MKANKLLKTLAASTMSLALLAGVTVMPAMAAESALGVDNNTVTITKTVNMAGAEGAGVPKATYNFDVTAYDPANLTGKENNAKEGDLTAITNSDSVSVVFDGESASETFNLSFNPAAFNDTGAGIYYYQLKEQDSGVTGITEDANTYILKAYVSYSGDALAVTGAVMMPLTGGNLGTKSDEFLNTYATNTLTITKNVTGNMGDKTKPFTFTIDLTDPDAAQHVNSVTVVKPDAQTEVVEFANGTATVTIDLKDTQSVTIKGLPEGTDYSITESNNEGYEVTYEGATQDTGNANLATGTMTTSAATVTVTNTRNATTPTGVIMNVAPYALMVVIAVAGVAVFMRKRVED